MNESAKTILAITVLIAGMTVVFCIILEGLDKMGL